MTRNPAIPFLSAVLRAGLCAAVFSVIVLGVLAMLGGQPFWMPLNVTTQGFFGPEVAQIRTLDLTHTGFGLAIHVASCLFWAAIAVLLLKRIGRVPLAPFGTALLALVIDYGILPERLGPGWHLALSFPAVICGFVALGAGLWLGLSMTRPDPRVRREPEISPAKTRLPQDDASSGPDALRHPQPHVIDQRQQRIDPTNEVTEDPNQHGAFNMKQPGGRRDPD